MSKLIITAALTGGFHGRDANPNLPEQPDEIAQAAYDCWQAGAAIVHLHARDKSGKVTCDPQIYAEIVAKVRARCDVITQVSTGGGPGLTPEERSKAIEVDADMASLNMGTMVRTRWGEGSIGLNTRSQIESYAKAMLDKSIKPEMEVYSHSMIVDVNNLIEKNLVKEPYYIDFVLGMTNQGALPGEPKHLLSLIEYLPEGAIFNVSGVGPAQLPLTTLAMLLGGHSRVGLEDNIYYTKGILAKSNAQLVERTARIARELGREPASPGEARQILQLGAYGAR
ncbi:MAG: 3-keto-5-aminohexanoate cleavage protein [Burkholderiales bacterium]|nr:3-keto-5-aminohexanoate cleavage protein [Burkholderiales bacterium]MBP9804321.1 3-keto-5-aminohexanoate cleavage protein [Accumulibacter sp.]MCW5886634.1 3-keto-5-aminohexanoate cleavage protein [Anaerolineales bacterium]